MLFWKELARNLRRYKKKTAVALLVSTALAFFLFLFVSSIAVNENELKRLSETADLHMTFVNTSGTRSTGIIVYDKKLQKLEESGLAQPRFYALMTLFSDGSEDDTKQFTGPRSNWANQPMVSYTDDSPLTEAGPENLTYFDGYDSSIFSTDEPVCLMSREKFQRMKLTPGQDFPVTLFTFKESKGSMGIFKGKEASLKIVGTFENPGSVFSGIDVNLISPYHTARAQFTSMKLSIWPSQSSMNIPDPTKLNELKALLKELEILPVQQELNTFANYGNTAVINDSLYIGTAEPTMRTLSLLRSLYPAVFAAVALIALLAAYLLIQSRREEIAIQRSLGTGRLLIFLSLLSESLCVCLSGTALAALLSILLLGLSPAVLLFPALGFLGSYLLGCAIAVLLLERTDVLAVLARPE